MVAYIVIGSYRIAQNLDAQQQYPVTPHEVKSQIIDQLFKISALYIRVPDMIVLAQTHLAHQTDFAEFPISTVKRLGYSIQPTIHMNYQSNGLVTHPGHVR